MVRRKASNFENTRKDPRARSNNLLQVEEPQFARSSRTPASMASAEIRESFLHHGMQKHMRINCGQDIYSRHDSTPSFHAANFQRLGLAIPNRMDDHALVCRDDLIYRYTPGEAENARKTWTKKGRDESAASHSAEAAFKAFNRRSKI